MGREEGKRGVFTVPVLSQSVFCVIFSPPSLRYEEARQEADTMRMTGLEIKRPRLSRSSARPKRMRD